MHIVHCTTRCWIAIFVLKSGPTSAMNRTRQAKAKPLAAVKVRHEPPTIEEAVQAARDLASDTEQQVEIAAGLMGLGPDEVRTHVLRRPPAAAPRPASDHRRTVVVERRAPRLGASPRPTILRTSR